MDFRLDTSRGWQALLILCAALSKGESQYPPMINGGTGSETQIEVDASLGTTVKLPCYIRNSAQVGVTWTFSDFETIIAHGDNVEYNDTRFSVDHTSPDQWNLVIQNVVPKDDNTYQCMVNSLPPEIVSVKLTVLGAKPSIDRSALSPRYIVNEGERLQVDCLATGIPNPTVQWFKYTPGLSTLDEKKELFSSTNFLETPKLMRGDGNIYGCVAKNEYGEDMYEIFVDIIYKPELSTVSRSLRVKNRDSVTLTCIVDSNPNAKTFWYRNGVSLHTSWKYFLATMELQSERKRKLQLKINQMDLDDSGVYLCKALNKVGMAELPINITVSADETTTPSTTTTTTETTTTELLTTTQSQRETVTVKPSTPLSIEEPRTGGSSGGGPPCIQHSTSLLLFLVVLALLPLS